MDRDNQQIPGFGFDPGYEPSPAPTPSVPSSTSLFGLISKVNKGILKQPLPASTTPPDPASQSIQQARAVAQKLSNIDPNIAKQRAFQNAKSVIDNIQRGIWTPQTTDQKQQQVPQHQQVPQQQQQPVNTGFKVPFGAPRSKPVTETQVYKPDNRQLNVPGNQPQSKNNLPQNVLGNLPQIKNTLTLQQQPTGTPGIQQPVVNQTPRSIVPYSEESDPTSESNYSRQKALEEIDRYRGSVRKEMKDNSFEEKRAKKNDSFKSDFDRYYYGSDMQRSEIVDKLHRSSTINKTETEAKLHRSTTNDYNEKYKDSVKPTNYELKTDYGTRKDMDTYTSSQYSPMDAVKSRDEYEDFKYSREYGTGERTAERKLHNEYKAQSDRYMDRKQDDSVGMDRPKMSASYNSDLHTSIDRKRDYEPPQRRADPPQRRAEPPQRRAEHENQRSSEKTTYTGNYDTYQQDSRNRNVRHNSDGSDSRTTDSPNVFDYGHATKSFKYDEGSLEDRYADNRHFDDERHNRDADDHNDDRFYRENRYSEEREYYRDTRDRYQDKNNDQRYDDDGYDMSDRYRDEREMNYKEDEYGRDMQEMEDFPEDAEDYMDKKSQDGEMLYEEYLFGIEDEEVEEGMASPDQRDLHSHRRGGTSGRSERYTDSRDRYTRLDHRDKYSDSAADCRDKYSDSAADRRDKYSDNAADRRDKYSDSAADRRDKYSDSAADRRDKYSDSAADRKDKYSDSAADRRVDDRNLPITDDQKVLEKPTPQPVPPPVVSVVAQPVTSSIPMMLPATTQILTPVTGIFCKDCNVMCIDQEIFDSHLKSDIHILTLQRKAQELFHMQSKQSRFDFDMAGNPLRAQVLPPPVLTGIPSSALTSSGRNVFIGDAGSACDDRDDRGDSPTRFRSRSDSRIQVIPPKPLGPLEAQSVHQTWLILQWRARHEEEEELIDKYVVEYRNAREIRWVRVGATIKHEYEVNGLQEGTDYLFRVYTMNRKERSEYLESVLITTKKKKDSPERGRRRSSRERNRRSTSRDRGHRSNSMDRGHRSSSRDRGQRSIRDRRPVQEKGMKHIRERDRRRSGDRERRSSRDRVIRDSKSGRDKPGKERQNRIEKKSEDQKNKATVQSSSKTGNQEEEVKDELKPEVKREVNDDVKQDKEEEKKEEPVNEDIECLLYREFQNYENEAMLGLDHIYEIRSYMSMTPPRYVCKLCNNKGSHKIIVRHIMGFPHKLNFFKKYDAEVYEVISMIAMKKQQMERANYEARRAEDKLGRGSVRVMLQLNPHDHNGKTVYRDPIPVKAPPPDRAKEIGEAPVAIQVNYEPQFMALYNEHVEANALDDTTLIGLSYVKEILHPTMEKESRYSCGLCNVLCHDCSILSHLLGKRHRLNYLKTYYETLHDEIANTKDGRNQLLLEKIKMIAEKDGPGTMKVKVAKNDRLWKDKTSKTAESVPEPEPEPEEQDGNQDETTAEDSGVPEEESEQKSGVPAIKFGIKKSEPPPTNVKPINVLEQEQAATKSKEGFDWNKENTLLQSKIQNETIIKSSRKSKFITVYSEFFKRYPVIGMQWVTEFQKQDPKHEPWYMCFMCQQKQQWKHILDHVTSNLHRINYMKKSDYREKYNAVYNMMKTNKAGVRPLIEEFSKEISDKEGPPTELEVMIELNINTEAFKSVAKVQENVKAHATATTSSHSSIQINIATTSLPGIKTTDVTTTSGTPGAVSIAQTPVPSTSVVTAAQTSANLTQMTKGQPPVQYVQQPVGIVPIGLKPPPPLQPVTTKPTGTPLVTASFPFVHLPPPNFQAASGQAFPNLSVPPPMFPRTNYADQRSDSTVSGSNNQMPLPNVNVNTGVNLRGPATFTQRPGQPFSGGEMLQVPGMLQSQRPPPMFPQTALPHQFYPQSQPFLQGQTRLPPPLPVQQQTVQQTVIHSSVQPLDGSSKQSIAASATVQLPGVVSLATQSTQQGPTPQFGSRPPPWQKQPPLQTQVGTPGASNAFQQSGQPMNDTQDSLQSKKGDEIAPLLEMNFKSHNVDSAQEDKVVPSSVKKDDALDTKTGHAQGNTDINRGTKRLSEEKNNFGSNKRFSRDESITNFRQEGRHLSRQQQIVSSRGRSSREHELQGERKDDKERRRDFLQRNDCRIERPRHYRDNVRGRNDGGVRRNRRSRSRSPYRMDQRKGYDRESEWRSSDRARQSESRMGRREDTRHTIRKPSPRSAEQLDDRRHTKYQADFHEEDYNEPLAAAKIDDLIKQYSDRVDDDFGNIIGDQFDQVSDDGFDDNVLYDNNAGQRIRNDDRIDHRDDRQIRVKYDEHFENSRSRRFEHDEFDRQNRTFDRRNNIDMGRIRYNDRELAIRNDRYDEERRSRSGSDQLSLDRDRREMDKRDIEPNREKSMSEKLRDDRREDQWAEFPSDEIQKNRLMDARQTYTQDSRESTSITQRFTVRQADVGLERDFGRYEHPDPPREEIDALLRRVATGHSPPSGGHREYEGRTPRDWGRESRDRPLEKEGTTDRSGPMERDLSAGRGRPMNRGGSADRGGHMERALSTDRGRGRSSRASYRGVQRGSFRGRAQRPM